MKFDLTDTRIFLKPGVTDLRISTDEILHLIKNIMEKDPKRNLKNTDGHGRKTKKQ